MTPSMSFNLFPPHYNHKKIRTKAVLLEYKSQHIKFKVATSPCSLFALTAIFQKQLPKMPKEYIFRQVFDPKHKNLILYSENVKCKDDNEQSESIQKQGNITNDAKYEAFVETDVTQMDKTQMDVCDADEKDEVCSKLDNNNVTSNYQQSNVEVTENIIGGICYRSFYGKKFVEVVFCAVDSNLQIRGYGNFMMDCFKEHVKCEYWYNKSWMDDEFKDNGSKKTYDANANNINENIKNDNNSNEDKNSEKGIKDTDNAETEDENNNSLKDSDEDTRKKAKTEIYNKNDENVDYSSNSNDLKHESTPTNITDPYKAKDPYNEIYSLQHCHLDVGPHEFKANMKIGLNKKTFCGTSSTYLNPPYKNSILYIMTYADNYAIGYFKKNGFTARITFKDWIHHIKDYDGGTMMQSKLLPSLNYILKEEFIESLKTKLVSKLETMCDMTVYEGGDPRTQRLGGLENVNEEDLQCTSDINYVIKFLLSDLQNHPSAWPFLQPVKQSEVPDYYVVIKQPMDLGTMQKKMEADGYFTLDEFVSDFMLMTNNCYVYNSPGTQYHKCALNLEDFFFKRKASFEQK